MARKLLLGTTSNDSLNDKMEILLSNSMPSKVALMQKLVNLRQKDKEPMKEYIMRFNELSCELLSEEVLGSTTRITMEKQVTEMFLRNLTKEWRDKARIIMEINNNISRIGLQSKLKNFEQPDDDYMDVDQIQGMKVNPEEILNLNTFNNVINKENQVNFQAVTNIPTFMEAFRHLSKRPTLRPQMERILKNNVNFRNNRNFRRNDNRRRWIEPRRRINEVNVHEHSNEYYQLMENEDTYSINELLIEDQVQENKISNNMVNIKPINVTISDAHLMYVAAKINRFNV